MMEAVLKTLSELASIYPDYPGTIERDGLGEIVRLRYFAKPCEMMIEEKRLEWNRAVRDLDAIAPNIISILEGQGQTISQAETHGASVMYHFLKDDWKPNRGSINSLTNAFRMISNQLEKLSKAPLKGKQKSRQQRDKPITQWLVKNDKRYEFRSDSAAVREYMKGKKIPQDKWKDTFYQLYEIDFKNDKKANPLLKRKPKS